MSARLIVCALVASGCMPMHQTLIQYSAAQDAVRLAPRPSFVMGGSIQPGRLMVSGGLHYDYLPNVVSGPASSTAEAPSIYGQRTASLSGGAAIGVRVSPLTDVAGECTFGDASRASRLHPALSESSAHEGALWRCTASQRFYYPTDAPLRVVGGISATASSALLRREITETITMTTFVRDGSVAHQFGTRQVTVYDERKTLGLFSAAAMLGGMYEPRPWLSFELFASLGFEPAFSRSIGTSATIIDGYPQRVPGIDAVETYRLTPVAMSWFGAAFGPPVARFALRINGNVGDFGGRAGAIIGAEAAMVFGLPVFDQRPSRAR